jgi:hypothetical protein
MPEPLLAWVKTEFRRRFGLSSIDETVSRQEIAVMKTRSDHGGLSRPGAAPSSGQGGRRSSEDAGLEFGDRAIEGGVSCLTSFVQAWGYGTLAECGISSQPELCSQVERSLKRRSKKSMKERPGKTLADYFGSQESQPNNGDDRNSSQEESKDVTNCRCHYEFLIGKQLVRFCNKTQTFVSPQIPKALSPSSIESG